MEFAAAAAIADSAGVFGAPYASHHHYQRLQPATALATQRASMPHASVPPHPADGGQHSSPHTEARLRCALSEARLRALAL